MKRITRYLCVSAVPAVLILATTLLPGCNDAIDPWPAKPGPRVLATFAPLYCFALNVAGDDAQVLCVMSETGPHHFNPSPRDAVAVQRADLFVINGLDLDTGVARKMSKGVRNANLRLVHASDGIPRSQLREGACNCGHEHGDHDHHHHGDQPQYDPHVWLGIPEAILMVEKIRDELKARDAEHAANYDRRAAEYVDKLKKLQADGREMLKNKTERKLLTFHDSLRYFARSFDLEIAGAIEAAPGAEPDAKTLSDLVKQCREQKVRHIAVEPQYDSNTSAKVILRELKNQGIAAEFITLDPIETATPADLNAGFYEKRVRENLKNLADRLK